MYAKGMSTPDINTHLNRIYGFEVSPETVSRTTDSLFKLLYLVTQDIQEKWIMPIRDWGLILNQLMVYFEGRV